MTPSEWHLLLDGHMEAQQLQERRIARWLSPLISVSGGHVITPAQLLGEEELENNGDDAARIRATERKLKTLKRKIARRLQKEAKCQARE